MPSSSAAPCQAAARVRGCWPRGCLSNHAYPKPEEKPMHTYRSGDHVTVLSDHAEVPGIGFLPVNAFVLHGRQPLVVDTGLALPDRDFVADPSKAIDPADVRCIFLTHPDRDHTGAL